MCLISTMLTTLVSVFINTVSYILSIKYYRDKALLVTSYYFGIFALILKGHTLTSEPVKCQNNI